MRMRFGPENIQKQYQQDVFVKHQCPRNGHSFEKYDLDI